MKKLFIDISPGFYKTKLLTEISKKIDVLVIYTTDYDKSTRNKDFMQGNKPYEYLDLKGSRIMQWLTIMKQVLFGGFDEVIVGGYDNFTTWLPVLVSVRKRNSVIIESTFRETKTQGIRAFLKKVFFKRVNRAYVCGSPHEKLTRMFGFKGECVRWNSVGLINRVPQPAYTERGSVSNFLFVGRLIEEKNLGWLIDRFAEHPELNLSIIGFGPLEQALKKKVKSPNITFVGAINNTELPKWYQEADVFILPSKSETWGLVVEEALNNGTPVMLSEAVGCADDLVQELATGVVFKGGDKADFDTKLKMITDVNTYNKYRKNISDMDFEQRERSIVEAFI